MHTLHITTGWTSLISRIDLEIKGQGIIRQKSITFVKMIERNLLKSFYAPGSNDRGHIVFVLSVCLSVVIFNIHCNFWTVRGRDFIFGMHTQLMMPFQMTPRSMTFWHCLSITLSVPLSRFAFAGKTCVPLNTSLRSRSWVN